MFILSRRRFLARASGALAAVLCRGGAAGASGATMAAPRGGVASAAGTTIATSQGAVRAAGGAAQKPGPPWWDMSITVDGRGEYESRADAAGARYAGTFAFAFAWMGMLQKDDEDYLLVHKSCRLTDWRIEERGTFNEAVTMLTTADIGDKPELKVGYILKREGRLHIAFDVVGFDVPKLAAGDAFPLALPASAEGGAAVGKKYGFFVKTGSNTVAVAEDALARGPADKAFAWTWKSQGWVQKREMNIFQSSGHDARVRVLITPGR